MWDRNMNALLTAAKYDALPGYQKNKVRDAYQIPGGRRILISTDRQSAFDQILAAVPYKGQVLNQLAPFWFEQTKDICPNHVISFPDPNVMIVKDLDMLPIEIVVRNYLTGSTNTSVWPMYDRGERTIYGIDFADGMVKNQQLPNAIVTPTTKPDQGGHDAPITPAPASPSSNGRQSAVRIASPSSGIVVTMPSARTSCSRAAGAPAVTVMASALCVWNTAARRSVASPIAVAQMSRLRATDSVLSSEPKPQFRLS